MIDRFSVFIDEFHRDLLADNAAPLISKMREAVQLVATTGTPLMPNQLLFLQRKFKGTALMFIDAYKYNCVR
jgi:hypothetical protein